MQAYKSDAARRVATVVEKWSYMIKNTLPARREKHKRLNPYRPFAEGLPFRIRRFQSDSPVPRRTLRRGVPRRHSPMMSPLIARMGVNVGRWGYPATPSPRMPDCRGGVFAVFAKIPPPSTDTTINAAWMVFVTTWRAASRLARRGTPTPRKPREYFLPLPLDKKTPPCP